MSRFEDEPTAEIREFLQGKSQSPAEMLSGYAQEVELHRAVKKQITKAWDRGWWFGVVFGLIVGATVACVVWMKLMGCE